MQNPSSSSHGGGFSSHGGGFSSHNGAPYYNCGQQTLPLQIHSQDDNEHFTFESFFFVWFFRD